MSDVVPSQTLLLTCTAGVAGAGTGAAATEAGQTGAGNDAGFGSPQPGTEFSNEQPMEGDLGGDGFDWDQTGVPIRLLMQEHPQWNPCSVSSPAMIT